MLITKGYKVNGRYEIIKSIGEGGMANVYLAKDTILEREVAVKILRGDLAFDEKFVRRFQREALSASSLSHPNIVEMYDVGEDDGKYYIVMEFIEGKTLKQLIKKRGFLTVPEVVDIMLQLTDGLAHAHDSYIIHRDIKPQNILILDNGLVKITDFGIAMALNSSELTQTNSVMGSVHYLPPEQASGRGSTIKSDIYSLGIIMYELLTGKLPFKGENAVEIALKQLKDKMPNIRKQMTDIPQSIENIILKATAKNPKNRYNDAREMYQDLKVALDENQINQARHVYKYLEQDLEDTKIMPTIKVGKKKQWDDVVATKIDDQDLSKQNKWIKILVGTFLGLVVLLSVIFILIPFFTNVPDVKIPDVSGKSVENAESILEKLGFKVEVETKKVYSDIIEEGMVVETEPKIGRTVKKGTIITLYESLGTKHLETEDYTGQNYIEVKAILETVHGLNVLIEKSEVENPDDFDPNIIIGQNPEKGSKLVEGDTIILYIPNIVEKYPDMVSEGWTLSDAEAFVEKYELVLSVEYRETDEYAPNMVIEQKRAPGSVIVKGVTLKIVVATEPLVEDEEIIEE
jgi:serine/threonine protein kinase